MGGGVGRYGERVASGVTEGLPEGPLWTSIEISGIGVAPGTGSGVKKAGSPRDVRSFRIPSPPAIAAATPSAEREESPPTSKSPETPRPGVSSPPRAEASCAASETGAGVANSGTGVGGDARNSSTAERAGADGEPGSAASIARACAISPGGGVTSPAPPSPTSPGSMRSGDGESTARSPRGRVMVRRRR